MGVVAAHGAQLLHAPEGGEHVGRGLVGGGEDAAEARHRLELEEGLVGGLGAVGRLLQHDHLN